MGQLRTHVDAVRERAASLPRRADVYFEEWDEAQISAIRRVSELVGIARGDDCFPARAAASLGRDRGENKTCPLGAPVRLA